jgi:hypothetical protein
MDTEKSGRNMNQSKPNKLPRKPLPPYKIGDMVKVYHNHGIITDIVGTDYHITLFVGGSPFVMDRRTYGIYWDEA